MTFLLTNFTNLTHAIECDYHETLDSYLFNTSLVFQEYVDFRTLQLITPENKTYAVNIVDKKVERNDGNLNYIYYILVPDLYLKASQQYILNLSVSDLAGNIFSSYVCYSAPPLTFNVQLIKPKYNAVYQKTFPFIIKTSWPASECRFSLSSADPNSFESYPLLTKIDDLTFKGATKFPEGLNYVTISVLCKDYYNTSVFGPYNFDIQYMQDMPSLELSLTPKITTNPNSVFTLQFNSNQSLLCKYDFQNIDFDEMRYNLSNTFISSATTTFTLPKDQKNKKDVYVYVKCINKAEREVSKTLQIKIVDKDRIYVWKPADNCVFINPQIDLEFSLTTYVASCNVIYNNQTYAASSMNNIDFTSSIFIANQGTQNLEIVCQTMDGKTLTKKYTFSYIDINQPFAPQLEAPVCGGLIKGKYAINSPSINYETVFSYNTDINDSNSIITRVIGNQFSVHLNASPPIYLLYKYTISACDSSFNSSWEYMQVDDEYFKECTDIFPPRLEFYINNTKVNISTLSKMTFKPLDKIHFKIYDKDDPFKEYKEIAIENYTMFSLSFCFENETNITINYECPSDNSYDMTLNYISLYELYRLGFLEINSNNSCSFILNFTLIDAAGNRYNNATELHFNVANFSFEDTDKDGLPDDWEKKYFGSIDKYDENDDPDDDGVTNKDELKHGTDPTNPDTDGDGLNDYDEVEKYKTNPTLTDTDGDKLNDGDEVLQYHTDPLKKDTDNDSFNDYEEIQCGSNPINSSSKCKEKKNENDKDDDGLPDDWEKKYFGSIDKYDENDDPDDDGLINKDELKYGTDPTNPDTDGDQLKDGDEVHEYSTDPTLADTDDDGFDDYEEIQCKADPNDPDSYCKGFNWLALIITLIIAALGGGAYYVKKHPKILEKFKKEKQQTLPLMINPPSQPLPLQNQQMILRNKGIVDDSSLELLRKIASEPDEWDVNALSKIAGSTGISLEDIAKEENKEELSETDIEALQNIAKESNIVMLIESLLPEVLEGKLSQQDIKRRLDLLEKGGLINSETRKQIEDYLKSRGLL